MIKAITVLSPRGIDDWGDGSYGASRGNRTHKGIDYEATVDAEILSPVMGIVSKLGYPYADNFSYRYIEITDAYDLRHRFFYVNPLVELNDFIKVDSVIGKAQDIAGRYNSQGKGYMKNHIHYEILKPDGTSINPEEFQK